MADKRRYTVTLPDHVADAVDTHAKPLGATPTEYAADVLRWWFGQGCPPVSHDEIALRAQKLAQEMAKRVKPVPKDLNALALDPQETYFLTDDTLVQKLLTQLGLPNLFARAAEHDEARFSVAFDNHPTHWITADYFKGSDQVDGNGLAFSAYPKSSVTRKEMLEKLQAEARKMESKTPFNFSQIPLFAAKDFSNQTPTGTVSASGKR